MYEGKAKKGVKRKEVGVLKASEVGSKQLGGHLRGGSPAGKISSWDSIRGIFYPVTLWFKDEVGHVNRLNLVLGCTGLSSGKSWCDSEACVATMWNMSYAWK